MLGGCLRLATTGRLLDPLLGQTKGAGLPAGPWSTTSAPWPCCCYARPGPVQSGVGVLRWAGAPMWGGGAPLPAGAETHSPSLLAVAAQGR